MHDYLNGVEVKCFKAPSLELVGNDYCLILRTEIEKHYENGDLLPLDTGYYKYGKDMAIYDFLNSNILHIVKDGVLFKSVKIEELSEIEIPNLIINNNGEVLNVESIYDLFKIKEEGVMARSQKCKIAKWLDLNEIPYEERYPHYDKMLDINKAFKERWYCLDNLLKVKAFGQIIYCLLMAKEQKDNNKLDFCYEFIKKLREEDNDILEQYKEWQGLDDEDIDSLGELLHY